jgi:hypothetical protein
VERPPSRSKARVRESASTASRKIRPSLTAITWLAECVFY